MLPLNDAQVRTVLKRALTTLYSSDPNTVIVEELGLRHGLSRIDIAVINGSLQGFEIKSDCDTLDRLSDQMPIYNSIFDRITLVVGRKLKKRAIAIVPDWWGIRLASFDADGKVTIRRMRSPLENPAPEILSITKLLWRDEALALLDELHEVGNLQSKPRAAIYSRLAQVADPVWLSSKVRETMRLRTSWRSAPSPR